MVKTKIKNYNRLQKKQDYLFFFNVKMGILPEIRTIWLSCIQPAKGKFWKNLT